MAADDDRFTSKLRWDEGAPVDGRWSESTNNTGTFYHDPDAFIARAEEADSLFVRIWDYSDEAHDARFDLRGLSAHLDEHAEQCRSNK